MEVFSRASSLNPNAPLFVPMAYRTVEDFSDQWWNLVHSSPWFRDYWIQERFEDPQSDFQIDDDVFEPSLPEDLDSFFFDGDVGDGVVINREEDNEASKDLISVGTLKWQKGRAAWSSSEICGESSEDCECQSESKADSAAQNLKHKSPWLLLDNSWCDLY